MGGFIRSEIIVQLQEARSDQSGGDCAAVDPVTGGSLALIQGRLGILLLCFVGMSSFGCSERQWSCI